MDQGAPEGDAPGLWILTAETDDGVVTHVRCYSEADARLVMDSIKEKFGRSMQLDRRPRGWECGDPTHKIFSKPD